VDPLMMLLAFIALLVAWLFLRSRLNSSDTKTNTVRPAARKSTEYHAVSIKFSASACDAAKALGGQRFLASAAPTMPLPECNVEICDCHFAHHEDRRAIKDRRSPFASSISVDGTGSFEKERRDHKERREDDDTES
jgi:hypothetical protein